MDVKWGDTVKVHLTGMLEDGTPFVSSANRGPIEFTVGKKGTMTGLQNALIGMKAGESKIAKISAEDAYGPYRTENVIELEKRFLPKDLSVHVGQRLRGKYHDGRVGRFRVVEITDSSVTLDANHALAGRDVVFRLEVIEIVPAAPHQAEEAATGSVGRT